MRMRSPIPKKHARIEIIPLIDIMFFLLASFMMVSLSQTHMKGIRVNLPSPFQQPVPPDPNNKDYVSVRVSEGGQVYFDNNLVLSDQILPQLMKIHKDFPNKKVSISADKFALHGDVVDVLDKARRCGIQKIGYQVKVAQGEAGNPGSQPK